MFVVSSMNFLQELNRKGAQSGDKILPKLDANSTTPEFGVRARQRLSGERNSRRLI